MCKLLYSVVLSFLFLSFAGCARDEQPVTSAEKAAQRKLMREFLNDSSPRNMSQKPKVKPELTTTFSSGRRIASDVKASEELRKEIEENW